MKDLIHVGETAYTMDGKVYDIVDTSVILLCLVDLPTGKYNRRIAAGVYSNDLFVHSQLNGNWYKLHEDGSLLTKLLETDETRESIVTTFGPIEEIIPHYERFVKQKMEE